MGLFSGIHHASFVVEDTHRALGFYRDLLGMREDPGRPDLGFPGAWLEVGSGQQIHLLEVTNVDPVAGRPIHGGRDRHLALRVERLEPLRHALERAAVPFTLSRSGRLALFCRDPDGNTLELIEERGGR